LALVTGIESPKLYVEPLHVVEFVHGIKDESTSSMLLVVSLIKVIVSCPLETLAVIAPAPEIDCELGLELVIKIVELLPVNITLLLFPEIIVPLKVLV
jgi:hypothetical protein